VELGCTYRAVCHPSCARVTNNGEAHRAPRFGLPLRSNGPTPPSSSSFRKEFVEIGLLAFEFIDLSSKHVQSQSKMRKKTNMPRSSVIPMRLHKRSPSGDSDADSIANYGELKEVDQRQQADDEILAMEDLERTGKQGHSFCGMCCDMRRTVITLNTMILILVVISFALMVLLEKEVRWNGTHNALF
jgi:hypothetical protein